jgi:hypothetical protein
MDQTANTDDSNRSAFGHFGTKNPAIDSDSGTYQGRRGGKIHVIWEFHREAGVSRQKLSATRSFRRLKVLTYATMYSDHPPSTMIPFIFGASQEMGWPALQSGHLPVHKHSQ